MNQEREAIKVKICLGSSCFSRGNNKALEFLKEFIRAEQLEKLIDISGSLCEGKCNSGPHVVIDGVRYENVSPSRMLNLIKMHLKEKGFIAF